MKRILVVEDEEAIRTSLIELLKIEGFEVIGAENGRAGLGLAKQFQPHLIISDVCMPDFSGYDLLTELRKDPDGAAIPFVFLTARTNKEDFRKGMNLGADDYLCKPFTHAELLEAVAARFAREKETKKKYSDEIARVEQQLHRSLYFDELTGLPNRLSLRELFDTQRAKDRSGMLAVFSLCLDRFERLSKRFGDLFCDEILKAVSAQMKNSLPETSTVARLQSHHFVVLSSVSSKSESEDLADTLLRSLSHAFVIGGQEVFVSPHIGISLCPSDSWELEGLIHHADTAMNAVGTAGGHLFYSPEMNAETVGDLDLELSLRRALVRREFELHYQPQIEIGTGRLAGVEALLRWRHPTRGLILPGAFIRFAEETGLIVPIGNWVLATACRQIKAWNESLFRSLRVSVNVSVLQFNRDDFLRTVFGAIEQAGARPENIELELVESVLMQNCESTARKIKDIKAGGVRISVDDFGTGYSSLSYLKQFLFDTVKIDRSFINRIDVDPTNAMITRSIIKIAHNLKLNVIAEGVETPEELAFLKRNRCDEMQGYLYSPPLSASQFENLSLSCVPPVNAASGECRVFAGGGI